MSMRNPKRLFLVSAIVACSALAVQLGPLTGVAHAGGECTLEFDDADFFIEINATDGDAGVQLMLDGVGWNSLEMIDPDGNTILEVAGDAGESIGTQGITEFFFESAEPSFEEQTLAELLDLFPEGEYEFQGYTTDGDSICASAEFTHNIPAEPEPEVEVEDDDEVEICWDAVEDPYDDPSEPPAVVGDEIEIDMYRVVVEALDEEGDGLETLDVELPATGLCMSIPEEFLAFSPVGEFKYEVIATEDSGNQTIFEGEFSLEDDEDEDEDDDGERVRRAVERVPGPRHGGLENPRR